MFEAQALSMPNCRDAFVAVIAVVPGLCQCRLQQCHCISQQRRYGKIPAAVDSDSRYKIAQIDPASQGLARLSKNAKQGRGARAQSDSGTRID